MQLVILSLAGCSDEAPRRACDAPLDPGCLAPEVSTAGLGRFARRIARATAHRDRLISSLIFQNGAPSATNAAI